MYHFPEKVNYTNFFRFDRRWIKNMNWARISPAARAVLPVIACHCNDQGVSFPGEDVIAALSGRTPKTARQGIRDLDGFPGLTWEHYLTRRGKRGKRFILELPQKGERGRSFFFHRAILDGGNWAELSPAAQAVYPVLRYFSYFDQDEVDDPGESFDDDYRSRGYELCSASKSEVARFAGVSRYALPAAMESLKKCFLSEASEDGNGDHLWKVFLIPPRFFRRGYLNTRLGEGR